ncbi:MAG TPA: hypothetical protein VEI97_21235, partial [bacterium]|nr:hypothetical protein [bacterium]
DPGYGQATRISFPTSGASVDHTFVANLSGVTNGFHTLFVRVRDAAGRWSLTTVRPFLKETATATTAPALISKAEYYIDTDPGYGQGTNIPVTAGIDVNQSFIVDLTGVANGIHTLYVRVRDQNKAWSLTVVRPFLRQGSSPTGPRPDVVAFRYQIFPAGSAVAATPPQTYVIPAAQRSADVDITWTPELCLTTAGSYVIRMAALDSTGTPSIEYRHAFSLTTPTLFQPNLPDTLRACAGQPVTISSAAAGAGSAYLWNTGATTQAISVTTPGKYWVDVTSAQGCVGTDTVRVLYDAAPTVTLPDTVAAACGATSVTLDAGAGYASYLWSPGGATTRTLTATTPGRYRVTVTGAGTGACTATDSSFVVMPRADIAQADQTVCGGAGVTLSLTAPTHGSISWVPGGQTTPSITVAPASTTTYTATVRVGSYSCSDQVTLTVPPTLAPALPDTTVAACG